MANTLKFKRGLLAGIPTAALGEPLFTTDTFDLYIGNGTGNTKFQKFIASGATTQIIRGDGSLYTFPLAISSPSSGQVLKYNGTSWVNDSDAGITGSGAAGQVAYFTGATTQGGSNNLFWDASNNRLGIGTNTPVRTLDVRGFISSFDGTTRTEIVNGGGVGYIGTLTNHPLALQTNNIERIRLHAGGNLHVGGTTDNGLRFQVTGDGYFSGAVGVGTTSLTGYALRVSKNITGGVNALGIYVDGAVQNDVTSQARGLQISPTIASGTAVSDLIYYFARQNTFTGTATNQYAVFVDSNLTGATNNYAFYSNIASGTGRWNLYMNGTAANYLAGNLRVGTTTGLYEVTGRGVVNVNGASAAVVSLSAGGSTSTAAYLYYTPSNNFEIKNAHASGNLILGAAGGEHVILNASGNLGLGVTPSAWSTAGPALQLKGTSLVNYANNYASSFATNAYYNTSDQWVYYTSTYGATRYQQVDGAHTWSTASSGTANAAITFTQAMTLDASGRLLLGLTTSSGLGKLQVNGGGGIRVNEDGSGTKVLSIRSDFAGVDPAINVVTSNSLLLMTANTERARIFSDGNVAIGTTTNAGYKLDVNGTMRVSGASTLSGNVGIKTASSSDVLTIGDTVTNGQFIRINNYQATLNTAMGGIKFFNSISTGFEVARIEYGLGTTYVNDGTLKFYVGNAGGFSPALTLLQTGAATFSSSVTAASGFIAGSGIAGRNALTQSDFRIAAPNDMNILNAIAANASMTIKSDYYGGGSATPLILQSVSNSNQLYLSTTGDVGIGGTPAQKLDVTGSANSVQARFGNVAGRGLTIGTSAISGTNDAGVVFNAPTATDGTLVFQTSSTDRMTLNSSGLNVATALSIGTTPDTNLPFKILKNINSTVGIRFENTSTGASAFAAVQFGQDVSGGTAFANMVYANSSITESGVYKPSGTAIINTGSGGLNFLAVSQPIRFFTSTGNGTLRAEIANDGFINHYTGTAPTTNLTDGYRQYSADITAGNAAPHFRTENGGIIKLYQQTTAVTSATYIGGAGTTVTDLDTFDGYTIPQIVKALRNAGLLA